MYDEMLGVDGELEEAVPVVDEEAEEEAADDLAEEELSEEELI